MVSPGTGKAIAPRPLDLYRPTSVVEKLGPFLNSNIPATHLQVLASGPQSQFFERKCFSVVRWPCCAADRAVAKALRLAPSDSPIGVDQDVGRTECCR